MGRPGAVVMSVIRVMIVRMRVAAVRVIVVVVVMMRMPGAHGDLRPSG
jgi:hypothetical protein